ncbi:hypothetical protein HDV02_000481 [Globomyces sp. JEL0801]|nr:hypothetical protein HDV02_000481 [Globomyces sp. JEL0801]
MDACVLVFTTLVSISSSLVCYFNINVGCWAVSNPIQAISLITTVGYFDFYYVYLIAKGIDRLKFDRDLLQVLMPTIWTTMNSLLYTGCCLIYRQGGADFYVNALWNFASVLIPLVTIQSCISTNIGAFVQKKGPKSDTQKSASTASKAAYGVSKSGNILSQSG